MSLEDLEAALADAAEQYDNNPQAEGTYETYQAAMQELADAVRDSRMAEGRVGMSIIADQHSEE